MSSLTDQTPPAPPREPVFANPPAKDLLSTYGRKFAFAVLVSISATVFCNIAPIKRTVLYACSAVVHIGGDPLAGKGSIVEKLENKIDDIKQPAMPPLVAPAITPPNPFRPTEGELEARERDREARLQHKLDTLKARADAVGIRYDDTWPLGRFEVEVPIAERKLSEAAERKPLLAEVAKLLIEVDEEWDNKRLREEIKAEKKFRLDDASYQEKLRTYKASLARYQEYLRTGPNARCLCGYVTRFSAARTGTEYRCPRCQNIYAVSQAVARWRPPSPPRPPTPPSRKPSLLKRFFG